MHTLKRNILLHLQTSANLNDYPFIMIDIIINSLINFLIVLPYHHLYPFRSFFISQANFPTCFSYTARGRDLKKNTYLAVLFSGYADHPRPSGKVVSICRNIFYITDIIFIIVF